MLYFWCDVTLDMINCNELDVSALPNSSQELTNLCERLEMKSINGYELNVNKIRDKFKLYHLECQWLLRRMQLSHCMKQWLQEHHPAMQLVTENEHQEKLHFIIEKMSKCHFHGLGLVYLFESTLNDMLLNKRWLVYFQEIL